MLFFIGFMLCLVTVVGAVVAFFIVFYNSVIQLRIRVEEAWADIDTFLKQRYDMIPNLVSIVKGYMKHEEGVLTKITELRSKVSDAPSMAERAEADNQLTSTIKTLFAVAENYPDLKANQNFLDLQAKLSGIEDKLQNARRFYNATVRDYNTRIQVFPGNLIAGLFGFMKKEFFEAAGEERDNVKISFEDEKPATENVPVVAKLTETEESTDNTSVEK